QDLDVERDSAGHGAAPIQRDVNRRALDAVRGLRTGREGDRCARLAGCGQHKGDGKSQEETTTHEARQGTSARVRFLCPVSATELELRVFESVKVIGSGRVGAAVAA